MTTTNSTLILLFASVAASSTVTPLRYDTNPIYYPTEAGSYNVIREITEWDNINAYGLSQFDILKAQDTKVDTILEFAQKLINDSKDIDSEFVEIVNEHFWDLI